jgi:hypothetical protein
MKTKSSLFIISIFFMLSCSTEKKHEHHTHSCKNSERVAITDVVNKLFVYTDNLQWEELISEVFTQQVMFDVTSMGAEKAENLPAYKITEMWDAGLKDLDAVHHQAGNYIIEINNEEADVLAYSIASHYSKDAKNGTTREFVGSYNLHLKKTENGWRIDGFKYNLKYMSGNNELN